MDRNTPEIEHVFIGSNDSLNGFSFIRCHPKIVWWSFTSKNTKMIQRLKNRYINYGLNN